MTAPGAGRAIMAFEGGFGWLSNFHLSPLTMPDGIAYPAGEHAFQAWKTTSIPRRRGIAALEAPGAARAAGRSLALRPGWDAMRKSVMLRVVMAKFTGPQLRGWLCATGQAPLIEGNDWHDNYWGTCHCGRGSCAEPGANYLGQILMAARMVLRES